MADPLELITRALAGRYAVERQLGEGGWATVYLARDERHRRMVAVKVLKPELTRTIGVERFGREIESPRGSTIPTFCRCSTAARSSSAPAGRRPRTT